METIQKAIITAGGFGTRMYPNTFAVSKHLLPVYNKPMIYYPIAMLMSAGIRHICIMSHQPELALYRQLLHDGSQWGVRIEYLAHKRGQGVPLAILTAKEFIQASSFVVAFGDNFFYSPQ